MRIRSAIRLDDWSHALAGVTLVAWMAMAACGGSTVTESDGGSGGASASSNASSSSDASSSDSATSGTTASVGSIASASSGMTACDMLEIQMLEAHEIAVACDPLIDEIQCSGANVAKLYCDCEEAANDMLPEEAALSLALGTQWTQMGCEYHFCEAGCYPISEPWICDPVFHRCVPDPQ